MTPRPDGRHECLRRSGLRPELERTLAALGYEEPTPIQRRAVPPLLAGQDLLGQAATGTGKAAAFALPLLQRMPSQRPAGGPVALVLVPTRELAVQVSDAIHRYEEEIPDVPRSTDHKQPSRQDGASEAEPGPAG